jgi:hypothetical protein
MLILGQSELCPFGERLGDRKTDSSQLDKLSPIKGQIGEAKWSTFQQANRHPLGDGQMENKVNSQRNFDLQMRGFRKS